jgi:hypothetical protein
MEVEKKMADRLSKTEIKKLVKLGDKIRYQLTCDINDTGLPCRTCRLDAVELMVKYLKIHNIIVEEK